MISACRQFLVPQQTRSSTRRGTSSVGSAGMLSAQRTRLACLQVAEYFGPSRMALALAEAYINRCVTSQMASRHLTGRGILRGVSLCRSGPEPFFRRLFCIAIDCLCEAFGLRQCLSGLSPVSLNTPVLGSAPLAAAP